MKFVKLSAVITILAAAVCVIADDYAAVKAKLAKEPHLPSRVVFNDGVPSFQIGRKNFVRVMQYTCDYPWKYDNPVFVRQIGRLRSSGIHLYTVGFVTCERTTGENVAKEDKTAFTVTGQKTPDKPKESVNSGITITSLTTLSKNVSTAPLNLILTPTLWFTSPSHTPTAGG